MRRVRVLHVAGVCFVLSRTFRTGTHITKPSVGNLKLK
jgi:hypothetical protein